MQDVAGHKPDTGQVTAEPEGDELTVPVPPRFWWLKRILVAIGLLLVLMAGLRWWWGHVAHSRLQAEIDRIRAAGEPIFPEDFDSAPVPDAENAALVLVNAANAFVAPPEAGEDVSILAGHSRFTATQLADARAYVDANTNALRLLRQARGMEKLDLGVRMRTPVFNFMLPPLSGHRQSAKLLTVVAKYHHQSGNDAEAIAAIRDALALGDVVDHRPSLIAHLVAISIRALAARAVESVAPDLAVCGADESMGPGPEPARYPDVEALIADLLDEEDFRQGFTRALQCERMYQLDTVRVITSGQMSLAALYGGGGPAPLVQRVLNLFVGPLFVLDGVQMMHHATVAVEAARAQDWPTHCRKQPPDPGNSAGVVDLLTRPLSTFLIPSFERAAMLHYRTLADRRMAAIALAIRLYELDHGRRPVQLTDLVPEYLDVLPVDPFADDGRTFGYRPDTVPPVLYSIGPNGVDEEGRFAFRRGGRINVEVFDTPFFLDGHRPQSPNDLGPGPPASEQAADDHDEAEDDERNAEQD